MKNTVRFWGIIAMAAIFGLSFASCSGVNDLLGRNSGGGGGNTRIPASIASASAGVSHTVVITTGGELWAWGRHGPPSRDPVRMGDAANWASVSAAGGGLITGHHTTVPITGHTLVITTNGELWAWGANSSGQLGDGTILSRETPVRIGDAANWASVSTSASHSVALTESGELWAWGANSSGQLGDGTTYTRFAPVRVGTANWASASAGGGLTVAITTSGQLWAWGAGTGSQTPVRIGDAANWASVSGSGPTTGTQFTGTSGETVIAVAITEDGMLWDLRSRSNWVQGETVTTIRPERIGDAAHWASVSAGGGHFVAVT